MIGTLLNNRYRLDTELGHGGMGRVYRAHDTLLERDVAVKVLSDVSLGTSGRARLLREAQAIAQLNHPNIVSVYDAGEAANHPFIVMELVDGRSLHERPPQSFDEILSVVQQICAALDHAHTHGIVHRDLKPENVLITSDGDDRDDGAVGTAKLMDFGLARAGDTRLTLDGGIVGTVSYLAPEQALGQAIDGRADLYALGVMLYEWATGRLPFTGDDPITVISQHIHAPVVPPHSIKPDLPLGFEAIILKLLAKNPVERFASAHEVATALAALQDAPNALIGSTAPPRHNLPIQLTSFIGREKEIAELKRLLAERRLLTVTGSGGTGKTRLALQAAADLLGAFDDGVWLVELGSLSDPELVPQTVAAVLGVREEPSYPLTKALADYLRPKSLLLILDNCEHLIAACAQLAESLLRACPNVKIIASSREALGVPGETPFRVPSLSLPDIRQVSSPRDLMQYESVKLFVERAVVVRPEFQLTEANAATIAQICHRLDGVPLAIELAAARVRAMTPERIGSRLDDRFRLLTGGSRTALPRQQTLRALIDWSWDLLSNAERVLFRRLSVFLDGWTLEAAEVVAADDGANDAVEQGEVLELLTHLVEKSLAIVEERGADTRYSLLETIRQYARDKLLDAGADEAERVRSRHLKYFLALSDKAEPKLRSADQLTWLAQLETEHDNLRAALKWARGSDGSGECEIEAGLRLAGNLSRFWYLRGYWNEGRDWLNSMLSQTRTPQEVTSPESLKRARIKALCGAAWLSDENGSEIPLYTESLALCRQIGDKWGEAFSLRGLAASASYWGKSDVETHLQDSLNLFRDIRDVWGIALVLYNLGWLTLAQNEDNEKAEATWEECLKHFRQSGDRWGIAVTFNALGYVLRIQGDYPRAAMLTEEGLKLFRELGDKAGIATSLTRLGNVALRRGDYPEAAALLEKGIALRRERGDQEGAISALYLLGLVACYQGDYSRAVALLEESLALAQESGDELLASDARMYLAWVAYCQNDIQRANSLWQDTLAIHQKYGDTEGVVYSRLGLGLVELREGNLVVAGEHLDEGLYLYQAIGDKRYVAVAHHALGKLAHAQGDETRAMQHLREGLTLCKRMGDKQGIAETLEALAGMIGTAPDVGNRSENAANAAHLFAAVQSLRETIGAPISPVERDEYDHHVAAIRAQLDDASFSAAWAAGRTMTMEQAIHHALDMLDTCNT